LERSLSVLLPVHNAQATLGVAVARILDILPELTRRFDLLIIDDGSTDHTVEVAHELAVYYPQVRLARHSQRRGLGQAIRTGLAQTDGEMVFVHDTHPDVEPADLPKLWQQEFGREVLLARRLGAARGRHRDAWLTRLFAWAAGAKQRSAATDSSGFHIFRREMLQELRDAASFAPQRSAAGQTTRIDRPAASSGDLARPSFLAPLKRFALEE
jgi:glycosyltransferase involved in cell wall biosynthesis